MKALNEVTAGFQSFCHFVCPDCLRVLDKINYRVAVAQWISVLQVGNLCFYGTKHQAVNESSQRWFMCMFTLHKKINSSSVWQGLTASAPVKAPVWEEASLSCPMGRRDPWRCPPKRGRGVRAWMRRRWKRRSDGAECWRLPLHQWRVSQDPCWPCRGENKLTNHRKKNDAEKVQAGNKLMSFYPVTVSVIKFYIISSASGVLT